MKYHYRTVGRFVGQKEKQFSITIGYPNTIIPSKSAKSVEPKGGQLFVTSICGNFKSGKYVLTPLYHDIFVVLMIGECCVCACIRLCGGMHTDNDIGCISLAICSL